MKLLKSIATLLLVSHVVALRLPGLDSTTDVQTALPEASLAVHPYLLALLADHAQEMMSIVGYDCAFHRCRTSLMGLEGAVCQILTLLKVLGFVDCVASFAFTTPFCNIACATFQERKLSAPGHTRQPQSASFPDLGFGETLMV